MTQEEAAKSYGYEKEKKTGCGTEFTTGELINAFNAGAEWKNGKFIEKACGWLKEYSNDYIEIREGALYLKRSFIIDFKKHMEE